MANRTEKQQPDLILHGLRERIENSDFVLVGIGAEWTLPEDTDGARGAMTLAYDKLAQLLTGKPYFVLTECEDETIFASKLLEFFICAPFCSASGEASGEERWNSYLNWLSATLGHKLCVLELGVGLQRPEVIRWPFEKCVQFNQQAHLIRVHHHLAFLPEGLNGRGETIAVNACELFKDSAQE